MLGYTVLQTSVPTAQDESGALCLEETEQEETDIEIENYAEIDKVKSVIGGMRNGSTPLTLEDGTPVRDTVCQANTTMSMVPLIDDSDTTIKGSGLSRDYIIVIAVLGGVLVLFGGVLLFRRRSAAARVTQI